MTADNWAGWGVIVIVSLSVLTIVVSNAAAHWTPFVEWCQVHLYAIRNARLLIDIAKAYEQARTDLARIRAERNRLYREVERLERDIASGADRERSAITVMQLPSLKQSDVE